MKTVILLVSLMLTMNLWAGFEDIWSDACRSNPRSIKAGEIDNAPEEFERGVLLISTPKLIESLRVEGFSEADIEFVIKAVDSAKIITDRDTGRSKKMGTVKFFNDKRTTAGHGVDEDCDELPRDRGGKTIGAGTVTEIIK